MNQVSESLKAQVDACVSNCYAAAQKQLGRHFSLPDVTYNQRGKAAGSARLQQNQIRLNPILLKDNTAHFLEQVIPHEISHLLVYKLYGRVKPHGKEWKNLMSNLFGLTPLVQHSLDVSKVSGRQFDYQCDCGPVKLSIRRHNSIVRHKRVYICKTCGTKLMPA